MKFQAVGIGVVLFMVLTTASAWGGPRDAQWKMVEDAVSKGLPQSAIQLLDPIIQGAMKDKAYAEAVKAIGRKLVLEGTIQGNKPEEKITRLEAELAKAPAEVKPVLQSLLATWYWHYFQQNRWRFMQRTATSEAPGKDFTTWDLKRLFAEIDKHYRAALAAEELLKGAPVAAWNDLLEKGSLPDTYRPTMYDFLAHEALEFYASGEQAGARAEDAFELSADSPAFGTVEDFLAWKVETTDEDSPKVQALKLYQKLLTFHLKDDDRSALGDADLSRLVYAHNTAFGEEKDARYKAALTRFAEKWADHEISALARSHWAELLRGEDELVEARKVASQGQRMFPDSVGGRMCANLVKQIEAPSSDFTTERVWNAPWPKVVVNYRNLTEVHLRVVALDWAKRLTPPRYRPEQILGDEEQRALIGMKPVREWSAKLPATEDFRTRTEIVSVPEDLPPGFYMLIASHRKDFAEENNQIRFTDMWVSKLAVVMRSRWGTTTLEGFVLDNQTGEPLVGAKVRTWYRDNRNTFTPGLSGLTDKNGLFRIEGKHQTQCALLVEHEGQSLAVSNDFYLHQQDQTVRPFQQTIFFTDRSIYRPGQTVQYKGLCLDLDQESDNYKTIAGRTVTVVFQDPNGQEVERRTQRANAYGSFSGSFTAPRDRLMGQYMIRVDGNPPGATQLNIEEYKRPKFLVTLDAPKVAPKVDDKVVLPGKAMAYTGAAIDGAKVKYRVVREVRYPIWWGWFFAWRGPARESQEIAHGTAVTATDGTFSIEFVAKPDRGVSEKEEPSFHYQVTADVTDSTGETRTGDRSVTVAYTALQASLAIDEWQSIAKPVEIRVSTTTHDQVGQAAEGKLTVYRLKQPEKVVRGEFVRQPVHLFGRGAGMDDAAAKPAEDPNNPNTWPLGDKMFEEGVTTNGEGVATKSVALQAGMYRAIFETQDRFGKAVTAKAPLHVVDPELAKFPDKIPSHVASPDWELEPGEELQVLWGTGYDRARAFIEVEHRRKIIQSFWTPADRTQVIVKQAINEGMRGGFTVRITMVRENRAYLFNRQVSVPWSNKNLTVKWEHFVSKLMPGQKETWTAVITGPDAKLAAAEMVATLYDASLDAYLPHNWPRSVGQFRADYSNLNPAFDNMPKSLDAVLGGWPLELVDVSVSYRRFPADLTVNVWGFGFPGMMRGGFGGGGLGTPAPMAAAMSDAIMAPESRARMLKGQGIETELAAADAGAPAAPPGGLAGAAAPQPKLDEVSARKNLQETAFFFPHLFAGDDGVVKVEFTMPEALTKWRFMGLVHDKQLRSGFLDGSTVTAKDLMVQPNPPRFLREGDLLEFTVKVTNKSATRQTGTVRLSLSDARTTESVDASLGNRELDLPFDIPADESRGFSWKLAVPDGLGPIAYKAVGSTGRLSDGEEGLLPVLSRRVLVTESLPIPLRGAQTKTVKFQRLLDAGKSDTLKQESLTVQMVSNPSWYAVMALPYLMEFPHECSEQVFNRFYANALARHIAGSDPKIRRVFDQWKGTDALDSPLEKNQDLKSVMLEETPWLRQAKAESEARRNVGVLFDQNRLDSEQAATFRKLADMQNEDGAWPWFPGGPGNDYITLYVTTGFGRLRHLGVTFDVAPAVRSLNRLDGWINDIYQRIVRDKRKNQNNLSPTIALYLYGRSFFLEDQVVQPQFREAVEYFRAQARTHWLKLDNRQSQGHLAIALKRFGDLDAARGIVASLKERSVTDDELGRFWRETELSWWWYRAPIETQALMIEAFDEVAKNSAAVEECKVWLIKQKQTQDWKTTKATADAIYGLMLRGTNLLASDALVEVSLGDLAIKPAKVEAGTGFYEQKFLRAEVKPEMGQVTVKKSDAGVSWGSLHWQYLEDAAKVTPYEGTPLRLKKSLFIKENTAKGPVLRAVNGPVAVGDELVVRVELRTDRDMEYVHLKDHRGSGTEPVNVLSHYKYQDGLGYYETTRDTASHFFIDYLPKGTYVFEYSTRVVHKGKYQTGMAHIQCMYAPEFNSHSESHVLEVK